MIQGQGAAAVSGGRRRRGHRRVETSLSEINIVPLDDVMLVLLIVFMIAAMMQRGLEVSLPEARRAVPVAEDRVVVTIPISFRTDQMVQVDDDPIRVEVLAERMRQELVERTDKNVFLRGDREVTLQEAVTVMDELKEGGVVNVLLVTDFVAEL